MVISLFLAQFSTRTVVQMTSQMIISVTFSLYLKRDKLTLLSNAPYQSILNVGEINSSAGFQNGMRKGDQKSADDTNLYSRLSEK